MAEPEKPLAPVDSTLLNKNKDQDTKLVDIPAVVPEKYKTQDINDLKSENSNLIKDIKSDKYSTPAEIAMQKRMNRSAVSNAKDTNLVVNTADRYGININEDYKFPITDKYKEETAKKLSSQVSQEARDNFLKYAETHPNARFIDNVKINPEEEKRKARLQRAAAFADALYAFGEGMQGRTANPENFAFNRIQRKRDEQFQNFKNISESNKQTALNWEYNYRKDLMDWINKQLESEKLSEAERRKYKLEYDRLAQQQKQHEDEFGWKKIMDDRNYGLNKGELGERIRSNQENESLRRAGLAETKRANMAQEALSAKEFKEKYGDEAVSYESATGQVINRIIPKPLQKDIISKAKTNPDFKNYIQAAMNIKYQNVRNADGEIESVPVTALGKEVSDQDLLQSYLRWQTEGSPNENWPNRQNPGQSSTGNEIQGQQQPANNDPLDLGL